MDPMKEQLDRIEQKLDRMERHNEARHAEVVLGDDYHKRLHAKQVGDLLGYSAGYIRKLDDRRNDFPRSRQDEHGRRYWLLGVVREYQQFLAKSDIQ